MSSTPEAKASHPFKYRQPDQPAGQLPVLPTTERIQQGKVRVLSERRTGSRGIAFLHDDEARVTFLGFLFYEAGELRRVGHCFSLRHELGFGDFAALLEAARAAL